MRIGIASNDQRTITQHFGRTKGFVIAEIDRGQVVSKSYRENTFSMHRQGGHEHGEHTHAEHGHSHSAILAALEDCDLVLARGMGRRIYEDLRSANIQSVITKQSLVDGAIEAYINGTLDDHPEQGCQH